MAQKYDNPNSPEYEKIQELYDEENKARVVYYALFSSSLIILLSIVIYWGNLIFVRGINSVINWMCFLFFILNIFLLLVKPLREVVSGIWGVLFLLSLLERYLNGIAWRYFALISLALFVSIAVSELYRKRVEKIKSEVAPLARKHNLR